MSIEYCGRSPSTQTARHAAHVAPVLPADVAFLLTHWTVGREPLDAAVIEAERLGVPASDVLLADGTIGAASFYRCLARHLGLPFVSDWPALQPDTAVSQALRRASVRLADGRWLLAPRGREIALLVEAQERGLGMLDKVAIATPAHVADLVCHRLPEKVASYAAAALPTVAPACSARRGPGRPFGGSAFLAFSVAGCGVACGSHAVLDLIGLLFLGSVADRVVVCLAGLTRSKQPCGLRNGVAGGDGTLPTYTVLVPLYDEACMVVPLIESLAALDYPRAKLEVLLLLEADDHVTASAIRFAGLPPHMRVVTVPAGTPRTKPRALNVGLMQARGTLVTIYDAEDRPESDQLRKVAACFAREDDDVGCVQARLAVAAHRGTILEALFAMEYAALFDLFNVGAARLGLPVALGGTSNHFRSAVLRQVGAWDAWNVTEDADLGIRLARFGRRTLSIESTTFEDAPRNWAIWLNQRRRWAKGWMQTLIVLSRDPRVLPDLGMVRMTHIVFLLTSLVASTLLTPIFGLLLMWHLAVHGLPVAHDALGIAEALLAGSVLLLGLAALVALHACGLRARKLVGLAPLLPLIVPYTLLLSLPGWLGLVDLLRKPFHWRKTDHRPQADDVRRSDDRRRSAVFTRSWRAVPPLPRRGHPLRTPG